MEIAKLAEDVADGSSRLYLHHPGTTCNMDEVVEECRLPVSQLRAPRSVRSGGLVREHVDRLIASEGGWPPLLVTRQLKVIDGAHRLAAAEALGWLTVPCTVFHGSAEEAYVEAIRRNTRHGLSLTRDERHQAAINVVRLFPEWSDRRIAVTCGISPSVVARLRSGSTVQAQPTDKRLGMDGRWRPAAHTSQREAIIEAVRTNPSMSLRVIAAAVDVSPETVRRVRNELYPKESSSGTRGGTRGPARLSQHPERDHGTMKASGGQCDARIPLGNGSAPLAGEDVIPTLGGRCDVALSPGSEAVTLERWLKLTDLGEGWLSYARSVPLSRVDEIADEARRRAEIWSAFAAELELRAGHARSA
jgi:hypothetical protein